MNLEKLLFKKIEVWILLLVIVFFIFFTILFGSLVLRSETARSIASIPENLKKIFSDELDIGRENRFGEKNGLIFHNKNIKYGKNFYLLLYQFQIIIFLCNLAVGTFVTPSITFPVASHIGLSMSNVSISFITFLLYFNVFSALLNFLALIPSGGDSCNNSFIKISVEPPHVLPRSSAILYAVFLTGERSNSIKALIGSIVFLLLNKNFGSKVKLYLFTIFSALIILIYSNSEFLKLRYEGQLLNYITGKNNISHATLTNNKYVVLYSVGY